MINELEEMFGVITYAVMYLCSNLVMSCSFQFIYKKKTRHYYARKKQQKLIWYTDIDIYKERCSWLALDLVPEMGVFKAKFLKDMK